MKVVAIIQARMGSTRLPGKIMKEVLNKSLLEYQIERVKRAKFIDEIVIATTTAESEKPIINLCEKLSIKYFRGSEADVLSRYYKAAKTFEADVVVRMTSDCPLIDPDIIDQVVQYYIDNVDKFDYVSNTIKRTFPRGMDVSVFSFKTLNNVYNVATDSVDREHVTRYIYNNPKKYRLGYVINSIDVSNHRWTVDTIEDFNLISKMLKELYPQNRKFTMEDCIVLLNRKPEWKKINSDIEQKKV